MNDSFFRKKLLAEVRKNDYAHAGEEDAIQIVMKHVKIDAMDNILDVGSGLGGTVNYLSNMHHCKNIIGIDIEQNVISYAQEKFKHSSFLLCDAINCSNSFENNYFDLIYHFNSFYCFSDQITPFKEYYKIAKPNANLIIFDYSSPQLFSLKNPFNSDKGVFKPINLSTIEGVLLTHGWQLTQSLDLTEQFINWYDEFIVQLNQKKPYLVNKYGPIIFEQIYNNFNGLLSLFATKSLGGSVIYATKIGKNS